MIQQQVNIALSRQGQFHVHNMDGPIRDLKSINGYVDDIQSDAPVNSVSREISYSYDNDTWSNYRPITWEFLRSAKLLKPALYLKFKFTKTDSNTGNVNIRSFTLDYEVKEVHECEPQIPNAYMGLEFCTDPGFDPYLVGETASKLESALNGHINKAYGMGDVRYFKVVPDAESIDGVLNEYSLWKETGKGGCDIKVVVPDNELPEPNLLHVEWGLDYENIEVHIDPQYFETVFGKGCEPRQEDFMHFKKFNKIYRVASVNMFRGTDGKGQYWIMNLKQYDENTAVDKSDETVEYLQKLISGHETNFSEDILAQGEDLINKQQYRKKSMAHDDIREYVSPAVLVRDDRQLNNGTPIIERYYDFSETKEGELSVVYKRKVALTNGLSMTFWSMQLPAAQPLQGAVIEQTREDRYNVTLKLDKTAASMGMTPGISALVSGAPYHIVSVGTDTIKVLSKDDITLGAALALPKTVLPGTVTDTSGMEMYIAGNKYLVVRKGESSIMVESPIPIPTGSWVGHVINLSTELLYLEWFMYQATDRTAFPEKYDTTLSRINKVTISWPEQFSIADDALNFYLSSSPHLFANFRLWKKEVSEEYHNLVLGSPLVEHSSLAHIIDNPDTIYNMDKLGKGTDKYWDDEPEYI